MAAIGGHAIALGGDADDDVGVEFGHRREAIAAGSSTSKSSAMKAAPARRAASPCSHSASHAARNPSPVTASRSEEHTSELQSLMRISYAVCCLKKKKKH